MTTTITRAQYEAFQTAYDFFNAELFDNALPHVLVTLQRHAKARGYFAPERFSGRGRETTAHELAMNPDSFIGRSDEDILSTLAHEMAHVWQHVHGTPPRRCYHDSPMGRKDEGDRLAAIRHGRARRQADGRADALLACYACYEEENEVIPMLAEAADEPD